MSRVNTIIAFVCMVLGLVSCREPDEMYDPSVFYSEPPANTVFQLPDTIDVKAEISSDHKIQSVILTLVNENKTPVVAGSYFFPNGNSYSLSASIPVTYKNLPGGSYNILITVTDGSDQRNKYLPVTLLEVPVRMDGYIVVTGQQMFESVISRLNPAFESDTQFIIPENYLLSGVHSGWGTFFFVSQAPSRLMALNTLDFEKDWEMSAEPPASLFTGIFLDDDLVFSTGNGDCGILSPDGTIILRTAPTPDKSIQLISADETFIYTSVVSSGGTVRELRVIYRVSGNARDDVPVQGEIKSLIPADGNVIVFFEINTGTRIMEYAPNDMIMTELNMLTNERIQSALKISDSEIMMLTDKNVISYDLSSSRFTAFKDQPYDFCRYERQSDRLYLVKDSTIYGFDRLSGDLVTEKSFPMKVLDFQILYNK